MPESSTATVTPLPRVVPHASSAEMPFSPVRDHMRFIFGSLILTGSEVVSTVA
ncbi:Uncharacterised protein [Mycobacterium tuberculosis]|nr:Uncharacterised protein [Mycobacterium tuberculosis]